jgi:hypothetical protein
MEEDNTVQMQSSPFLSGSAEIGSFAVKVELDQKIKIY